MPQSPYHDDRLDECPCLSIGENRSFSLWLSDMNQVADVFPILDDDVIWPSTSWPMLINLHREDKTWRGLATLKPDLADYVWRDLGDGQPVRVKRCQMCGVAPSAVDDCGMPSPACPYFGRNNSKPPIELVDIAPFERLVEEWEKRSRNPDRMGRTKYHQALDDCADDLKDCIKEAREANAENNFLPRKK